MPATSEVSIRIATITKRATYQFTGAHILVVGLGGIATVMATLSIDFNDAAIKSYLFYAVILACKVLLMVPLTANQRRRKKVVISPEDIKLIGNGGKVTQNDPDVERVRRAHYNDLENIPIFLFSGAVYLLTNPDVTIATNLFRVYTVVRFIHTYVYAVNVIPQPARAIAFLVGYVINWYMLIVSALTLL